MQNIFSLIVPSPNTTQQLLLKTNERTEKYGLVLTEAQAMELALTFQTSLSENRIIEVGCKGVSKLLEAFAASCYVDNSNFADIVNEMTEAFYHIKRQAPLEINDNAVIAAMVDFFDNISHGSIELFFGRDMEILIRYIQEGKHNWEENPHYRIRKEDYYDTAPDYTGTYADDF
ncbi:MAG: hypothetical protein E7616_02180 [Ruminococcaceae bacterium]|nr:hypothetical protein [Oscillospiraceae bacterium]